MMKPNWPILALAVGAFGIGTTEFAPMGLLPVMAHGLGVSVPVAGLLVSGYALGVLAGAPLMTLPTGRLDRKTLLLILMGLFTAGNFLSAISPNYSTLMAARIVTSLCHGAFFGVGSVVAGKLAGPGKGASAVAAMFSGLTIANIGGVPAAAWIGQHIGWRAAFAGIGGLGVIALAAPGSAGAADHGPGLGGHVHRLHLYRADPPDGDRGDALHCHRGAGGLWARPDAGQCARRPVR
jgi:DHA1 family inner membrane transport protein